MDQLFRGMNLDIQEVLIRLGLATVCGLLLGLDREIRGIAAGLRTHALVCVSSAIITISALDLYVGVRAQGGESDPLRVIQGLAQAIGFIAAGAIFVARSAGPRAASSPVIHRMAIPINGTARPSR